MTKTPDTSLTRRNLLVAGSAVTLVFAGGLVWRAKERGVFGPAPVEAFSPWELWNEPGIRHTPLALVAAGILASSPHNTQPWIFRVTDDRIELFADTTRNLGAFDPFLREMHIGLGCAVETMMQAATPNGYKAIVDVAPGSLLSMSHRGPQILAATLSLTRLTSNSEEDALYHAIPNRHTNRYPYDRARGLPKSAATILSDVADENGLKLFLFVDDEARDRFDAAVVAATEEIIGDREMVEASNRWMRESPEAIAEHRDGLNFDTAGLSPWLTFAAKMLPSLPPQESHKAWLAQTRDSQLPTARLTGLLAVKDRYDREQSVAVGRAWTRMQLAATALGFAMQPLNQPIETADRERQLGKETKSDARLIAITNNPEWQPTFAFRAGMAMRAANTSPRRSLKNVTDGA